MSATSFWWPRSGFNSGSAITSMGITGTNVCDQLFRADADITLSQVAFGTAPGTSVQPTNGLRVSIQSDSAGAPSGTVLGATGNGFATIAGASIPTGSGKWHDSIALGEVVNITKGTYFWLCFDLPTFVAGNVSIAGYQSTTGNPGFPYVFWNGAVAIYQMCALVYDTVRGAWIGASDWAVAACDGLDGSMSTTNLSFPVEVGIKFTPAFTGRVDAVTVAGFRTINMTDAFSVCFYDSLDALVVTATSYNDRFGAGLNQWVLTLDRANRPTLQAGQTYRAVIKTQMSALNVRFDFIKCGSLATMNWMDPIVATSRVAGSTWKDYNNVTDGFRRVAMGLRYDDTSGGGLMVHPGMSGGLRG